MHLVNEFGMCLNLWIFWCDFKWKHLSEQGKHGRLRKPSGFLKSLRCTVLGRHSLTDKDGNAEQAQRQKAASRCGCHENKWKKQEVWATGWNLGQKIQQIQCIYVGFTNGVLGICCREWSWDLKYLFLKKQNMGQKWEGQVKNQTQREKFSRLPQLGSTEPGVRPRSPHRKFWDFCAV